MMKEYTELEELQKKALKKYRELQILDNEKKLRKFTKKYYHLLEYEISFSELENIITNNGLYPFKI